VSALKADIEAVDSLRVVDTIIANLGVSEAVAARSESAIRIGTLPKSDAIPLQGDAFLPPLSAHR
jgi:hypothetical protein